ncbi:unnamed protein product [Eruca vesicaria subsp. sativa]|uniref:Uncharacterized protein n=1 Tax=Eruca vesicaria subsp. sativa TaxID=29727 RepID=A0ABC8JBR6_ERUVS|nr:unnamed protein product [Eruca vesicaria subsp. sativa]
MLSREEIKQWCSRMFFVRRDVAKVLAVPRRVSQQLDEERRKRHAIMTELDREQSHRQAMELELRNVTTFISNLYPSQFSATQSQPDSETQSPEDPVE